MSILKFISYLAIDFYSFITDNISIIFNHYNYKLITIGVIMKSRLFIFWLIFVLVLGFMASCGETMPLKEYKDASSLREKAIKYELQDYSKEQFDIAETNFSEAIILIDENNSKEAKKLAGLLTAASNSYQTVLEEGLPKYAEVLKEEIDLEREYSKDIKSYKIDKESYELAELNYINGVEALNSNNYEEAVNYFLQAKRFHNKAYFSTKGIFDESAKNIKEAEDNIKKMEELEKSSSYKNN